MEDSRSPKDRGWLQGEPTLLLEGGAFDPSLDVRGWGRGWKMKQWPMVNDLINHA